MTQNVNCRAEIIIEMIEMIETIETIETIENHRITKS